VARRLSLCHCLALATVYLLLDGLLLDGVCLLDHQQPGQLNDSRQLGRIILSIRPPAALLQSYNGQTTDHYALVLLVA
jgi:hypothetical protein